MAFKIKDNLDLYGNQLLNFALQSDSGFPQSPQVGHIFNYTGTGVMANHAVMCVDETTKAFKALAFVDEIATNTAFTELAERVDDLETALGTDEKDVLDTWEEVKTFLASIKESDGDLMTMLNSKLDKSGGTIESSSGYMLTLNRLSESPTLIAFQSRGVLKGFLGIDTEEKPVYLNNSAVSYTLLHEGNIGEHKAGDSDKLGGLYASNYVATKTIAGDLNAEDLYGTHSFVLSLNSSAQNVPSGMNSGEGIYIAGYDTGFMLLSSYSQDKLMYRRGGNSIGGNSILSNAWKTIAFTDSTVAAAQKLVTSAGADAVTVDTNGFLTNKNGALFYQFGETNNSNYPNYQLFGTSADGYAVVLQGGTLVALKTANKERLWINSSGNVTIGAEDKAGASAKLYVDGNIHLGISSLCSIGAPYSASDPILYNRIAIGSSYDGIKYYSGSWTGDVDKISHEFIVGGENKSALAITNGGNVLIGTTEDSGHKLQVAGNVNITDKLFCKNQIYTGIGLANGLYLYGGNTIGIAWHQDTVYKSSVLSFNPSTGKTTIYGDLEVEGNIIATKEVSAGGAGQEGESGAGGAEVISQPLAKGQSSYTITNTIKRSDIAVSLYEANVINGQTIWSLCLADIEVTNDTITVTFGSATSVNHKLVAVG